MPRCYKKQIHKVSQIHLKYRGAYYQFNINSPISPAQYCRSYQYRRKKPTQFPDPQLNFCQCPSPSEAISPKLRGRLRFLLQITLSALWVTSYFKIKFLRSSFSNLCLIAFGGIRNYTHFGILLYLIFCKTPYKIQKTFQIMTSFRTSTRLKLLNEKYYFFPHIA
jgi:hypothetical protein